MARSGESSSSAQSVRPGGFCTAAMFGMCFGDEVVYEFFEVERESQILAKPEVAVAPEHVTLDKP